MSEKRFSLMMPTKVTFSVFLSVEWDNAHMLQSIRDHTQGWIAGVIISILILSFALWGIHSYFVGGSVNNNVAEVNGNEITRGQLNLAYERLRRQLQASSYEFSSNVETSLKDRALESLINIQVLEQASLKQDYRISQAQINNYLESMPEFQVDGQFSVSRFQQILATTLYSANDFLDLIKTSLLIDQPRLGMIFTSFSLPYEVEETIALVNQERDIAYVLLPFDSFSKQSIYISQEKIKTYYQQHQDEFKTPEKVSIEYVELSVKDLLNKIKSSEEELKNFYNENTQIFIQPIQLKLDSIFVPVVSNATDAMVSEAKNKINLIYEKTKEGIDFSSLAKVYSLGHANISSNWINSTQLPQEYQKTLQSLKKPGQVSTPIRTADGFVLLKVLAVKDAELMPYEQVKSKVKEALDQQKAEELFIETREKLASIAYEHPDSLQAVATEIGRPIQVSELFTRAQDKDISESSKIREAAFSNDVLNLQNNSDVIQKDPETIVVIRIKSHLAPSILSLEAVQQQIQNKLMSNEIDQKTSVIANEIKNKLKLSANPEEVIQQHHLTLNKIGLVARHSTNVDPAILQAAFEMPKPDEQNKITYFVTKLPKDGYAILMLTKVQPGQLKTKEESNIFSEQIQNSQGLLEYELYKQSLMQEAKIVIQN